MKTSTSVQAMARNALLRSSSPTCGPTNSSGLHGRRRHRRAQRRSTFSRTWSTLNSASGGRRAETSRELPKFCTVGSSKPAASSAPRTFSTSAVPG
jgi:hypothetical protein